MYLDRGGSGVVGLFFDIGGNWDTTLLGGKWNNGEIDATDTAENHPATGHLKASLADNRLNGSWIGEGRDQPEPVELVAIPRPSCDGNEEWKRFDDAAWPVSFSYPASWRLEKSGNSITLTCPNPSEIAYDKDVVIKSGSGSFQGPPELRPCGDTWLYGPAGSACECNEHEHLACNVAKPSHIGLATVLDVGEHEWRTYCHSGGYVGQGYGEDRIMLLPHSWLEVIADGESSQIVDRLIKGVQPHAVGESKQLR